MDHHTTKKIQGDELLFTSLEIFYSLPSFLSSRAPHATLTTKILAPFYGALAGSIFQSYSLAVFGSLFDQTFDLSTYGYTSLIPIATNLTSGIWQAATKNSSQYQILPNSITSKINKIPHSSSQLSTIISSTSQPLLTYNPSIKKSE